MSQIKTQKHRQSKYFTIMLVPYSSKKTKCIKIPHFIFYVCFSILGALLLFTFFSSSQVNHFKNLADSFNDNLEQTMEMNSKLIEEKHDIENIIEAQKYSYEREKVDYQKQLEYYVEYYEEYYEEKVRELEEKLEQLDIERNEIYNLLSQKSGRSFEQASISDTDFHVDGMGGPAVEQNLDDAFLELEARLESEKLAFDTLRTEAEKLKPYLDAIPNTWPVRGRITSEVGGRSNPFTGKGTESHSGMDIQASTGTSVKATGAGKVTFAGWMSGYGYLVIINHGYGLETYYGHNSKLTVEKGDYVVRGDEIAKSGSTGRSTGPHVHYEVRLNGVIKNPRNYIKD